MGLSRDNLLFRVKGLGLGYKLLKGGVYRGLYRGVL